ncbi:hypothetical protein AYWB_303 [Aster yellows witches'-broom phytoplasma AYWB]|uniref:Uncharacterized protein n=2 Tax=16SrI (Aster yellows group) TaxID=3042590 RepID=Q2NJH3_AYWBP|nr:hypothetical protein AYWB_303 [Aster yellows witches'-broom phytoplasma AYWB]PEH36318.1 hypothetical protein BBA70_01460 [New Jersey aster yellows phytoplasma]
MKKQKLTILGKNENNWAIFWVAKALIYNPIIIYFNIYLLICGHHLIIFCCLWIWWCCLKKQKVRDEKMQKKTTAIR